MEKTYKQSRFNITVDFKDGKAILYNSLKNAFMILSKEETTFYNELPQKTHSELSELELSYLDKLFKHGFLTAQETDELKQFEETYNTARNSNTGMSITITPTLNCNFSCHYCYQGALKEKKELMSEEIAERIVQFLKTHINKELKNINITWFGGEPTMGMKRIKEISDKLIPFCDKNNISYKCTLISNAYSLTPIVFEALYIRRLASIQITLDGPENVHDKIRFLKNTKKGSFGKIVENIKAYSEIYPTPTSIRVNIDSKNNESISELLQQLADAGLGNKNVSVYFAPIVASTSACSEVADKTMTMEKFAVLEARLLREAQKLGLHKPGLPSQFMGLCGATKPNSFVFTNTGDIHKCWETVSVDEYKISTLADDIILMNDPNIALWDSWSPFNYENCRNCEILPVCSGFCPYKFIYKDEFTGNSADTPCPSIKFNIKDRLTQHVETLIETGKMKL